MVLLKAQKNQVATANEGKTRTCFIRRKIRFSTYKTEPGRTPLMGAINLPKLAKAKANGARDTALLKKRNRKDN